MENEYLFIDIESYYNGIIAENASLIDKAVNSRKIIEIILRHYLSKPQLKREFNNFYIKGRKASDNSYDRLVYLIEKFVIPADFENDLNFIRKEANETIHTGSRKVIKDFDRTHLPHIKEFVLWFYKKKNIECFFVKEPETPKKQITKDILDKSTKTFLRLLYKNKKIILISSLVISSIILFVFTYKASNQPFEEIKIGNQIWSNEIDIPLLGSYCYNDLDVNCKTFNRLYSYETAKKIANKFNGWEIPIKSDYEKLIKHYGSKEKTNAKIITSGESKFKAILSGSKSVETINNKEVGYIDLGKKGSYWTSSRGSVLDKSGRSKPFSLNIEESLASSSLCNCSTIEDALSLRLIKTDRGYLNDYVKDSILTIDNVINYKYELKGAEPIFSSKDPFSYKILILPFNQNFNGEQGDKDLGLYLYHQLNNLRQKENNGIFSLKYLSDNYLRDYSQDHFKVEDISSKQDFYIDIKRAHNADMIIFGSTGADACNPFLKDDLCVNYINDIKIETLQLRVFNEDDYMSSSVLASDFITGDFDFMINWLSALMCYAAGGPYLDNSVFKQSKKYALKIKNFPQDKYKKNLLLAKLTKPLTSDSTSIVNAYVKVLSKKPMCIEALLEQAPFLHYNGALSNYSLANNLDNSKYQIFYNRAEYLSKFKKYSQALKDYKIALKLVRYQHEYDYIEEKIHNLNIVVNKTKKTAK